jgi:hypothetical protein
MMYLKYIKYLTKVKYLNKKLNIIKMSIIIIIITHTICWFDLLELSSGKKVRIYLYFVHSGIEIVERQIYLPFLHLKLL